MNIAAAHSASEVDSAYAWARLGIAMLISTIGGVGMWSFVVALPTVQTDFGVVRADASLAYTLLMIGFAAARSVAGSSPTGSASVHADMRRAVRSASVTSPRPSAIADGVRGLADSHRAWHVDGIWPADRRRHALVREPARHRGRTLLVGQLFRRGDLAADLAIFHLR